MDEGAAIGRASPAAWEVAVRHLPPELSVLNARCHAAAGRSHVAQVRRLKLGHDEVQGLLRQPPKCGPACEEGDNHGNVSDASMTPELPIAKDGMTQRLRDLTLITCVCFPPVLRNPALISDDRIPIGRDGLSGI